MLMLLAAVGMTACKSDDATILKRNTDALSFTYMRSTQTLIVLSDSRWTATPQQEWISCTPDAGRGNGVKEQNVEITVEQNDADAREGEVILSDGTKALTIRISQEDGFFEIGNIAVPATLNRDEEISGKYIAVAYRKAKEGYKVSTHTTLSGAGAEGFVAEDLTEAAMEAGDGEIRIPLTGTPTVKGKVGVAVEVSINDAAEPTRYNTEFSIKSTNEVEVKTFKLLPRLAVFDWGFYAKTSDNKQGTEARNYDFSLHAANDDGTIGEALRSYKAPTAKWFANGMFFEHTRFAFGNLTPATKYWFRIVAHEFGTQKKDSDVTDIEFTTPAEVVEPNVVLYKDFDDYWFRGCPLYMAFGPEVPNAQIGKDIDVLDNSCYAGTAPVIHPCSSTDSFFDYVSSATDNRSPVKCPILWYNWWEGDTFGTNYADTDYAGWQGLRARCTQGSVLLSFASASGYLKTPLLTALGDTPTNITFVCHTAPYFEPYHSWGEDHNQHYIRVEGPGEIVSGGATMDEPEGDVAEANSAKCITVKCEKNVGNDKTPLNDYVHTTEHIVKIEGATKDTRIVIEAHPYGVKHYRLWIDDVKVLKD